MANGWTNKFLMHIEDTDNVPFLYLLGCGGQSGYYAVKAKHSHSGHDLALMIMNANLIDSGDDDPHVIVNYKLDGSQQVVFEYNYHVTLDRNTHFGKAEVKKINQVKAFTVSLLPSLVKQRPELIAGIARLLGSDVLNRPW